jgi:GTP-binding protein
VDYASKTPPFTPRSGVQCHATAKGSHASKSSRNRKKSTGTASAPFKHTKTTKKAKKTNTSSRTAASSSTPIASATLKKSSQSSTRASTPPWQVLSTQEARKNVHVEKERRERVRLGLAEKDPWRTVRTPPPVFSKSFLTDTEQRLLKWTRFNPVTTPAGMQFLGSFLDKQLPPRIGVPEIAFLGRSNVGKSSLLNRLSSSARQLPTHNDQARVGKTPGATASVNLYALLDAKESQILGWVDLPGFGYAKLSKQVKESVQETAENYLARRQELVLGILLVDARRIPSNDDRAVLAALFDMGIPVVVVATKVDKLNPNELRSGLAEIRDGLGLPDGQPLPVSSVTGEGTRDLWRIILEACETGVADFKSRYEEGGPRDDADAWTPDFDDSDDLVYDQGYDWIHDANVVYQDDEGDFVDDEDESQWEEEEAEPDPLDRPHRETLKSLRKRVREMERRGDI